MKYFASLSRTTCCMVAALLFTLIPFMADAFAADPARPQIPRAPFPYERREVAFEGGAAGVTLAGTLTVPSGATSMPAVVLVHGSGKTDRDESAFGHKPFWVLADALSRAGYAVLRYDKRGVGQSTGDGPAATTLDFESDARAAVDYLKRVPGIDPKRIAIIGHSEGGTIAALMSGSASPPAAAISLGGMIAPFAEQIILQEINTGRDDGADSHYETLVRRYYGQVEQAARTVDDAERMVQMKAISQAWVADFPASDRNAPAAEDSLLAHPGFLASRWFRTFLNLDVAAAILRGHGPLLVVNGSTDHQVAAGPNLNAARQALGRETATRHTLLLHGLNHLLQESASGSSNEYASIEQTMSPRAINAVIAFLNSTIGATKNRM
ncbi:alpha/beta fold hydrolase [Luteibacter sp. PPL552]